MFQTGIWNAGKRLFEIRDIIGDQRTENTISLTRYYPQLGSLQLPVVDYFNLAAFMEKTNLVVSASTQLNYLITYKLTFDAGWNRNVLDYLVVDDIPIKLCQFDGIHTLVLWSNSPHRSLFRPSHQGSRMARNYAKATNVVGRDMNFDYNKSPVEPEADPRISILFGENKIEVLKSSSFEQERVITISEWSDLAKDAAVFGTVLFIPNSAFLVAAKMGERAIAVKKYA